MDSQTILTNFVSQGRAFSLVDELQTPLANIKLSVEILGTLGEEDDRKLYLDIITRNVDRIDHFINAFSRRQMEGAKTSHK